MFRNKRIETRILRPVDDFGFYINFYINESADTRNVSIVKPFEFEKHVDGETIKPSVHMSTDECVSLMDVLWQAGIRPSNGEASIGQIGATEKHLNDMRAIVAKNLEIPLLFKVTK